MQVADADLLEGHPEVLDAGDVRERYSDFEAATRLAPDDSLVLPGDDVVAEDDAHLVARVVVVVALQLLERELVVLEVEGPPEIVDRLCRNSIPLLQSEEVRFFGPLVTLEEISVELRLADLVLEGVRLPEELLEHLEQSLARNLVRLAVLEGEDGTRVIIE